MVSKEEYDEALRIVNEYHSQFILKEGKCVCGGDKIITYEPNAFPYGDNLQYSACNQCGKKYDVHVVQ